MIIPSHRFLINVVGTVHLDYDPSITIPSTLTTSPASSRVHPFRQKVLETEMIVSSGPAIVPQAGPYDANRGFFVKGDFAVKLAVNSIEGFGSHTETS